MHIRKQTQQRLDRCLVLTHTNCSARLSESSAVSSHAVNTGKERVYLLTPIVSRFIACEIASKILSGSETSL
jgi:hypothetical protein